MAVLHYRQLIAWQKAMDVTTAVYEITRSFPADERYGLTNQLRRCSVSIASNIAEGQGRKSAIDFCRFLRIARGSVQECETQLLIAERPGYANVDMLATLFSLLDEVGKLVRGLSRSLLATDN